MSAGLASDEVAEDYKNSLEDLTGNDKFQISNLTVIAKENTEHAMAISRVLENHIRTVGYFYLFSPSWSWTQVLLLLWTPRGLRRYVEHRYCSFSMEWIIF